MLPFLSKTQLLFLNKWLDCSSPWTVASISYILELRKSWFWQFLPVFSLLLWRCPFSGVLILTFCKSPILLLILGRKESNDALVDGSDCEIYSFLLSVCDNRPTSPWWPDLNTPARRVILPCTRSLKQLWKVSRLESKGSIIVSPDKRVPC